MSVLSVAVRLFIKGAIVSLPIVSLAAPQVSIPDDAPSSVSSVVTSIGDEDQSLRPTNQQPIGTSLSPSLRPLNIAMLMPSDESPFLSAAKIVGNGLIAANRANGNAANIMLIEAPTNVTIHELLDAAVFAGADVVVGPLQKDRVEILSKETHLPIPTVALNHVSSAETVAPANMLMLSVATDLEAQYIAQLAIKALPKSTTQGETPKVLVITTDSPWEKRLSEAYEKVLVQSGIPYEVFTVTMENLQELQDKCRPELAEAERLHFRRMELAAGTDAKARKAIQHEARTRAAIAEPPFQAALLALDARTAGLVRNRLPLRTRVWATSTTNPGDPKLSSSASALAYDLNQVVFTECPLVARYDSTTFEQKFKISMPYSMPAKRLFALGIDAYTIAQDWARGLHEVTINGETGLLELNRNNNALIGRIPSTFAIHNGTLSEVPSELISVPGDFPELPAEPADETNADSTQITPPEPTL